MNLPIFPTTVEFHVSGCLVMVTTIPLDFQEAMGEYISLTAEEVKGHLDKLLQDAKSGQLQPLYNEYSLTVGRVFTHLWP